MSTFFGALGSFGRTYGTSMNGEVQKVAWFAKARKYPSNLTSQLDGPNIPESVYSRLVDGVNRNLPAFHRYLKLRARMMKLDQLHYYDLYAPLVASVDLKYTPGEAQKLVLAAVEPLGADYQATIGRAFDSRWIDLYPNDGKVSGAYSNGGAYDVHPYMLINYNGQYNDVSTLAHELGHTMQSYYSNKTQPYPLANSRPPDISRPPPGPASVPSSAPASTVEGFRKILIGTSGMVMDQLCKFVRAETRRLGLERGTAREEFWRLAQEAGYFTHSRYTGRCAAQGNSEPPRPLESRSGFPKDWGIIARADPPQFGPDVAKPKIRFGSNW
jgi:hypothetical protein